MEHGEFSFRPSSLDMSAASGASTDSPFSPFDRIGAFLTRQSQAQYLGFFAARYAGGGKDSWYRRGWQAIARLWMGIPSLERLCHREILYCQRLLLDSDPPFQTIISSYLLFWQQLRREPARFEEFQRELLETLRQAISSHASHGSPSDTSS